MHDLRGPFYSIFFKPLSSTPRPRKCLYPFRRTRFPVSASLITSTQNNKLVTGLALAARPHAHHSYQTHKRKYNNHPRTSFRVCCFKVQPVSSKLCLCSGRYGVHTLHHNFFPHCIQNCKRASFEHRFLIEFSQKVQN